METEKEMTAIQKTQVYLENYREIERYIKDAISEVSQIDDVSRYNISAEKAFLQSIRECKAETVILFEHMKKALASLKEDAEAAGEGYKYDALEAVYIKGKSYEGDRMRKELTEKVVQINDRTSLNQIIRCKSNRK